MEWRNTLRAGILCLALLIPGPLLALLKIPVEGALNFVIIRAFRILEGGIERPYLFLILFLFSLTILVAANVLGFNAFRKEHEDQAFEYLLTFPVSKARILFHKLIPRLLVLGGMIFAYIAATLAAGWEGRAVPGKLFFLIDPVFFPFVVLTVFFCGFLIGIFEQKDLVSVVTLLSFLSLFALPAGASILLEPLYPGSWSMLWRNGLSFIIGATALLLILGASALPIFLKMDVRSLSLTGRRFTRRAIGPLAVLCLGSFLLILIKK